MFEQLVLVDHPNIVKLHKYWLDVKDSKARVGRARGGRAPRGPRAGGGMPVGAQWGSQLCSPGPAQAACRWLRSPWAVHGAGGTGRTGS